MGYFENVKFASLSDEILMSYVKKGKEKAFDELYDRYSKKMLFFFYRRLHQNYQKAQDFLQDLFLKVTEKSDSFDETKKFSVWIYTIAANLCKNEYRKLTVRPTKSADFKRTLRYRASSDLNVEERHDLALFSDSLYKELSEMDEKHSLTFILKHQQNLSIREISKIMACPEGTVKSRLFYAIKILSQKLRIFDSKN